MIGTLNLNKTKLEKTVEEEQIKLEEIQNQIIEKQSNLKDELKKTGFEKAKTLADEIKKQTDDTIKQKLLEKKQKLNIYNDEIEKIDLNIKQLTEQLKKCHPEVQVGGSNNLDTDCPNRDFILKKINQLNEKKKYLEKKRKEIKKLIQQEKESKKKLSILQADEMKKIHGEIEKSIKKKYLGDPRALSGSHPYTSLSRIQSSIPLPYPHPRILAAL